MVFLQPQVSIAVETFNIYGVKIKLRNNITLNGYIRTFSHFDACEGNNEKWNLILTKGHNYDGDKIRFIGKLSKINNFLVAAKSSVKEIELGEIKSIEGVCRKWGGESISVFESIPLITDHMAEYSSNHKLVAHYTFDAEDPKLNPEEYAYGQHTTYFSYNPNYPRQRLKKERKIIDKMSDDVLDKNKLIRFVWYDD